MKKKAVSRKRKSARPSGNSNVVRGPGVERVLFENFISLQNVLADLALKLDGLTNKVSELVDLFEASAKSIAEKDFNQEKSVKDTEKMVQKMDSLLEQNKIIAKGLTLMHDKISPQQEEIVEETFESTEHTMPSSFPMRRPPMMRQPQQQGGYQKSIGSDNKHIPSEHNA